MQSLIKKNLIFKKDSWERTIMKHQQMGKINNVLIAHITMYALNIILHMCITKLKYNATPRGAEWERFVHSFYMMPCLLFSSSSETSFLRNNLQSSRVHEWTGSSEQSPDPVQTWLSAHCPESMCEIILCCKHPVVVNMTASDPRKRQITDRKIKEVILTWNILFHNFRQEQVSRNSSVSSVTFRVL